MCCLSNVGGLPNIPPGCERNLLVVKSNHKSNIVNGTHDVAGGAGSLTAQPTALALGTRSSCKQNNLSCQSNPAARPCKPLASNRNLRSALWHGAKNVFFQKLMHYRTLKTWRVGGRRIWLQQTKQCSSLNGLNGPTGR